jgi:hypothetical protein
VGGWRGVLFECWETAWGWMLGFGILVRSLGGVFGVVGVIWFDRITR